VTTIKRRTYCIFSLAPHIGTKGHVRCPNLNLGLMTKAEKKERENKLAIF
jgi:hypothetical protein